MSDLKEATVEDERQATPVGRSVGFSVACGVIVMGVLFVVTQPAYQAAFAELGVTESSRAGVKWDVIATVDNVVSWQESQGVGALYTKYQVPSVAEFDVLKVESDGVTVERVVFYPNEPYAQLCVQGSTLVDGVTETVHISFRDEKLLSGECEVAH